MNSFADGLVMSTSFGIQSAVMLHLVTQQLPKIPVIFIDTGYLFPETYRFAEELTERLSLDIHLYKASTAQKNKKRTMVNYGNKALKVWNATIK